MEFWAHQKNIEHLEEELQSETDPVRRRTLEAILHDERERMDVLNRERAGPKAAE